MSSDRGINEVMARIPSKRKFLTDLVLVTLEKTVDGYLRLEDFLYNPGCYAYGMGWSYPLKKASLAQALRRLREQGFVELVEDKDFILRLTDSGRDRALWKEMMVGESKWDGRWRIVVWDIPERRRVTRDLLRYKLKQLGFTQWQKSMWASKVNCTKLLRDYIKKMGIGDWVMVIESDNVGL